MKDFILKLFRRSRINTRCRMCKRFRYDDGFRVYWWGMVDEVTKEHYDICPVCHETSLKGCAIVDGELLQHATAESINTFKEFVSWSKSLKH